MRRGFPVIPMALALVLVLAGVHSGAAQAPPAAEVVRAAVAALERDGYVARFRWDGSNPVTGEVRYETPLSYGMFIRDEHSGDAIEYLLIDPALYSRVYPAGEDTPSEWIVRAWHPDAPIFGLTGYPPRLPLELLRAARSLTDSGEDTVDGRTLRRIEGMTSYFAALTASYNDVPAPTERQQTLAAASVPLIVWLDPADGRVVQVALVISPEVMMLPAGTLTYAFETLSAPLTLDPPADAREVESTLLVRPGPAQPAQLLPITVSGSGRVITAPPFITEGGLFRVTLTPTISDLQYQLWRVKRDRLLIAGFGALTGPGGSATIPFALQPGEYVFEVQLPEPTDWTLTIEEVRPETVAMP